MPRETINPKSMYDAVSYGFSHATKSNGRTVIHCAGQVAWDDKGELVGAGDLAAQAAQAFRNLTKVLAEAGAKRISLGSSLARIALGALMRAGEEIRDYGTFGFAKGGASYAEIDRLMRGKGA